MSATTLLGPNLVPIESVTFPAGVRDRARRVHFGRPWLVAGRRQHAGGGRVVHLDDQHAALLDGRVGGHARAHGRCA